MSISRLEGPGDHLVVGGITAMATPGASWDGYRPNEGRGTGVVGSRPNIIWGPRSPPLVGFPGNTSSLQSTFDVW